jgi:hypothetical protein
VVSGAGERHIQTMRVEWERSGTRDSGAEKDDISFGSLHAK